MRLVLYNTIINILIYVIVYLFKSFIIWEFTNPIQWIIDIPNYTDGCRTAIITMISCWQIIQIILIKEHIKE